MKLLLLSLLPLLAFAQPVQVGTYQAETRIFHTTRDARWTPAPILKNKEGATAEARPDGLYLKPAKGPARKLALDWALTDIRGITFDSRGRLWFAAKQGAGVWDGTAWTLYTGANGLPYDDFTCIAPGEDGVVWFGTRLGAIRFDGKHWAYRQGPRWLADDEVRSISVNSNGDAFIATATGLAEIRRRPTTLKDKAAFFEAEIDKRHRRTSLEYVHPVVLTKPGDPTNYRQVDSDNDGLWTSMYGAGECFAYAATGSEAARARAIKAFEAMRFLGTVTQGGSNPAPKGFVARSILPVSGPDPNVHDSPARDRQRQQGDHRWKVITPRWPKSADGRWYWKTDTSSDELDGHYFFYALYYDLVTKTEAEKQAVRQHVAALTDHLLVHNYRLVDHDGAPTRWSIFNPEELNHNRDWWQERGMNSLSILAYLKVAEHITGDARYAQAARTLIDVHGYGMNAMIMKSHLGAGAGNQSDDEMIFMNYYSLLRYEKDPDLRQKLLMGFHNHFQNEQPELNPVFNFLYAAIGRGAKFNDAYGEVDLSPQAGWLEDAVDTLKRLPEDRIDWPLKNSHRKDIIPLAAHLREGGSKGVGYKVNGKVLPIDERYVGHWNHDPWRLDYHGAARSLGDGAIFLLPYYMGLYHGFIAQ